jgi:uncharacterized protein (UPF0303 family)
LDDTIFDLYLQARKQNVAVRLLTSNYIEQLIPALERYKQQYGSVVEVRSSKDIHDRVIFIDGQVCWSLGQSIKDAARAKPTSLVPLAPDIGIVKQRIYEAIWQSSTPIS